MARSVKITIDVSFGYTVIMPDPNGPYVTSADVSITGLRALLKRHPMSIDPDCRAEAMLWAKDPTGVRRPGDTLGVPAEAGGDPVLTIVLTWRR